MWCARGVALVYRLSNSSCSLVQRTRCTFGTATECCVPHARLGPSCALRGLCAGPPSALAIPLSVYMSLSFARPWRLCLSFDPTGVDEALTKPLLPACACVCLQIEWVVLVRELEALAYRSPVTPTMAVTPQQSPKVCGVLVVALSSTALGQPPLVGLGVPWFCFVVSAILIGP